MTKPAGTTGPGAKLAYGFGAVAFGVKNNGFDYFLLIFYSQVLGVPAPMVGLALLLALMLDAVSDPLVGYLSDNTHSRWGRRHPWMYGSAIPVALTYFMLWNPPTTLDQNGLFAWLLVFAILIRTLITFYEVPSSALVAEMTTDYDQRTAILGYRFFFGWVGGIAIATLSLALFLVPTETISNGLMNREGYATYGMFAAAMIFISIMVSALGTHAGIPNYRTAPPKTAMSLGRILREVGETLANRSFAALFVAAILGAIATGLAAGLNYYINGFFWGLSSSQIALLTSSIVISAGLGLVMAPWVSRWLGKKQGAIIVGFIAFATAPLPVALRLVGVMPENGDPLLFPILMVMAIIDVGLIICAQILVQSMITDLVEENELRTGRRAEGLLFSTMAFIRKAVQGFGVMGATVVLSLAQFPTGASPGEVAPEVLNRLGLYYAPTLFVVWMAMVGCLTLYTIDRKGHEDNVAELARRAAAG